MTIPVPSPRTVPAAGPAPRRRLRRLLLPILAALPVLAILLALGTWQVNRMLWKRDLLARLDAAEAAAPVPLRDPPMPLSKVVARGRLLHDREALVGLEVRDAVLGAQLVTPLARADGAGTVLVDRGWVPLERRWPVAHPEGEVEIAGYVHPGDEANPFAARDDVAGRRFYTFDPAAIAAALGLPGAAPYALVALGPAVRPVRGQPPALPVPATALPRPTDPHLGYAVTWYGVAFALCAVLAVFLRRRWKDQA